MLDLRQLHEAISDLLESIEGKDVVGIEVLDHPLPKNIPRISVLPETHELSFLLDVLNHLDRDLAQSLQAFGGKFTVP